MRRSEMTGLKEENVQKSEVSTLREEIISLAKKMGIDKIGFTSRERLNDAPPSGDLSYVLPSAQSAISLAVALDKQAIRDYLGKKDWMSHVNDFKQTYRKLKEAGLAIQKLLEDRGYEAVVPYINFDYRPGQPFAALVPPLSLRYVAVAAGMGWIGWSGNVITPEYGAPVSLGAVVTSARFEPDTMVIDDICQDCRLCAATCASYFIDKKKEVEVTIGGHTFKHNKKASNLRCDVTCGGANGAKGPDAKWSTWSYHVMDLPGPDKDEEFERAVLKQHEESKNKMLKVIIDFENNQVRDWEEYDSIVNLVMITCGNCSLICWPDMKDRKENYRLLTTSGKVVKGESGPVVVKV